MTLPVPPQPVGHLDEPGSIWALRQLVEARPADPRARLREMHLPGGGARRASARMISERTKAALAAAKARGVKLGNPKIRELNRDPARKARDADKMRGTLDAMRAAGLTQRAMVVELNKGGVTTPRGSK